MLSNVSKELSESARDNLADRVRWRPVRGKRTAASLCSGALVAASAVAAFAVDPATAAMVDSVSRDQERATVREFPGRLVLANALPGDRIELTGYCQGWVRVRVVQPQHAMATTVGWVLRSSLREAKKDSVASQLPDACGRRAEDADRWRNWVGAMNAPFQSLRQTNSHGAVGWRRVTFGTRVQLAASAECSPSLNYTRRSDGSDVVDPAQRVEGLDLRGATYRYVTSDGSVALISAPRSGTGHNVWAFVPSACLSPAGDRKAVYFDEPVVQLRDLAGIRTGVTYSSETIRAHGCSRAVPSASHPKFGYWPDPHAANRAPCPV